MGAAVGMSFCLSGRSGLFGFLLFGVARGGEKNGNRRFVRQIGKLMLLLVSLQEISIYIKIVAGGFRPGGLILPCA